MTRVEGAGVTRRSALTGSGAVLASGLPACGREVITETLTLRVTLTAEAKGETYSNATVITKQTRLVVGGSASGGYKRHAPYVDLGSNGVLFLPFTGGGFPQLALGSLIHPAYGIKSDVHALKYTENYIMSRLGIHPFDLDRYPTELDGYTPQNERGKLRVGFIYFPDRLDPNSARWKSRPVLLEQHGIFVKSVTFEAVKLPETDDIDQLLPWIKNKTINDTLSVNTTYPPDESAHAHVVKIYQLKGLL